MKQNILSLLSEALPAVDFESDFLFSELDSLGIVRHFSGERLLITHYCQEVGTVNSFALTDI